MELNKKKELLKQAWKEVFDVKDVADDADFFEEGGDSIKAVQLSSWLIQKGIKLDMGKIFYTPVLSDMVETLEETDAMYVPNQLMTKELIREKYDEVMSGKMAPSDNAGEGAADEQICDPNMMNAAVKGSVDEQICDPNMMNIVGMGAAVDQICDPNMTNVGPMVGQNIILKMFKLMITQQQTVIQMMELIAEMVAGPAANRKPVMSGGISGPGAFMQNMPADKKAAFQKIMSAYSVKKTDSPIEKPNVIEIHKAKVAKPTKSAEEVLEYVLNGILKNGLNKSEDLFEQGLTSLDTVKLVTRCGEHGYSIKMQDIYMHSTFEELVKCMTPGE